MHDFGNTPKECLLLRWAGRISRLVVLSCLYWSGSAAWAVSVSCTNTGPTAVAGFTSLPINITPVVGDAVDCAITNTPKTSGIRLRKTWVNAVLNDSANFSATGLTTLVSVANTANETDIGAAQTALIGSSITLAESFNVGSAASYTATLACTGNTRPLVGNVLTVDAADSNIVCTFTNTAVAPVVKLAKVSVGGTGSFSFSLAGVTGTNETINTASAGVLVTSAVNYVGSVGTAVTVTEAAVLGYRPSTSCTDANGASNGNGAGAVTSASAVASLAAGQMRAGAAWTCTFTNARIIANLSVAKVANPSSVKTGGTVVFTLTVNNAGPDAANGAILRDKPTGLSCTTAPGCSASGGASCPSAALLTAAALTSSAGVAIPTLPNGGQVVVTLSCVVTADGLP